MWKQASVNVRILKPIAIIVAALALEIPVCAQDVPGAAANPATAPAGDRADKAAEVTQSAAVRMLEGFKDSDVKFDVNELVDILRDRRHEGWVLAAYPDPRTSQPLIGAGFSLDLPERPHEQPDPMNPHSFLEPSSADLWQAAGFSPDRLNELLNVFYERRRTWSKHTWRRQLYSLPAQISDDEATQLVRVGAVQAIYNAKAYCRNFDQMSGPAADGNGATGLPDGRESAALQRISGNDQSRPGSVRCRSGPGSCCAGCDDVCRGGNGGDSGYAEWIRPVPPSTGLRCRNR